MDFLKIAKAWITSYNPTEKELNIANERYSICNICPSKVKTILSYDKCNECGCPISKKIFSNVYNDCPLEKWELVDVNYFPPIKKTTSLI